MSTKRKFYVLYSLLGDITPKIFKSKATIKKYIDKQPNLNYFEFLTEKEAEDYVRKASKNI